MTSSIFKLRAIKVIHTLIWGLFASCIFAIYVTTWHASFRFSALLIGIVFLEVMVLGVNGWTCPLTRIAARFTSDRQDNFDIYLPEWIAHHNKRVFGIIYFVSIVFTFVGWLRASS